MTKEQRIIDKQDELIHKYSLLSMELDMPEITTMEVDELIKTYFREIEELHDELAVLKSADSGVSECYEKEFVEWVIRQTISKDLSGNYAISVPVNDSTALLNHLTFDGLYQYWLNKIK